MDTKALRQKILDLAIRGKLVPQDPNDEPASVLLERIRAEKQQMVKDGKLKAKDIKNDTVIFKGDDNLHYEKFTDGTVKCIEDEIPFELPDGWAWVRINTACIINPRNNIDDNTEVSFVPMANISEGYANSFVSDSRLWRKVKTGYTHFAENDIGIAKISPCFENKKSVVFTGLINGYGAGTTELHIIRTISGLIVPEYLLCFAKRNDFILGGVQTFSGEVGQQRVTKDYIANYLFSLPPLNEQKRIISAIKEAYYIIENIEKTKLSLTEDVNKAKSKILDLAIRGKLVPQNPNDEPASVLLERILAEKEELIKQGKIKRDKKESVIFKGDDNSYYEKMSTGEVKCIDDELPFVLPEGWEWARLNCISINYDSYRKPINSSDRKNRVFGKSKDELYPYYGATGQIGFIDDYLFNGEYILLGEDAAPFLDKKAQKAYMIKGKSWVNNHAHILQSLVSPEYLTNCLNSIDYFNYVYGTTRLKLTQENMNRILIPVPSIEEQLKIAQTINNLFALVENIKASLR